MIFGILLTLGAILLGLIGAKVASWIKGTPLNLLIALTLFFLSVIAAILFFVGNPHSVIILAVGVTGIFMTFFLAGVSIRLAKKLFLE